MSKKIYGAQNSQSAWRCPISKKSVVTHPRQHLALPDGKTNWWRCPECNGWHISIVRDDACTPTGKAI